ncbi:hypothetical protein BD408DRAFT_404259 [Parasitella parasitica]|nr:hypothetical protein BD408DRAFT_404259 [Parasitella parasitica]
MGNLGHVHTDAFTIPWTTFPNPYINPAWNLITRVLHKIIQEQLPMMTLVVPFWSSALWFSPGSTVGSDGSLVITSSIGTDDISPDPAPSNSQNWMLSVQKLSGQRL